MNRIISFVKRNPARVYGLVVALASWLGVYAGLPPDAISGIVTMAAIVLGESTRRLVTPKEPNK